MTTALNVPGSWLTQKGTRLDANCYVGPGQKQARAFIANDIPKMPLSEVTVGGTEGVFLAGRFRRVYVDNPANGYPFVTGSNVIQADPRSNCNYISTKYTRELNTL